MSKNELTMAIAKRNALDFLKIITGVFLIAFAVSVFFEPNSIVTGGVSGLSIICQSYARTLWGLNIPISVFNLTFNTPLLIAGWFALGRQFIGRTIFATLFFSVAITITSYFPPYYGDYVIVSVFGGAVMGTGVGLALSARSTTGGSSLLSAIINSMNKTVSVSSAIMAVDTVVIAIGFLVFGIERGLYGIISVFITSKLIDAILEGPLVSKGVFIISDHSEQIANEIMHGLQRGVTGLNGRGMFTKKDSNVLLCVVSKKEVVELKSIVTKCDKKAFMMITDVRETLGNGFAQE